MSRYPDATQASAAAGWELSRVTSPSPLFGANGMRMGPDGRLVVVQAFGSQVSALDPDTGEAETLSPVGGPIVAPDDVAFDSHGTMYVTEVMNARVCARSPRGEVRLIADNVPAANGITTYQDRIFMDECRPGGRLFELYPDGREPRVIAENLPLPNALSVGPDGFLYFPQVYDGEIWRCPLDAGKPERFMDGFAVPTAVKFDRDGLLTTTQAASGEVLKIDIQSGRKTRVATLRPGIDNLAFDDANRLFVSHFVDGGVAEIDADGNERVLAVPGLLGPFDVSVAPDGTIYAADGMCMLAVTPRGDVERPTQFTAPGFPGFLRGLSVLGGGEVAFTTSAGEAGILALGSGEPRVLGRDLDELYSVVASEGGGLVVAEGGAGRVLELRPDGDSRVLARGLARPGGLAWGPDGSLFVGEIDAGRVSRLDGGASAFADGFDRPHGVAVRGDDLLVLDTGAKSLFALPLGGGERRALATGLPVGPAPGVEPELLMGIAGLIQGPLPPFSGLAVGGDGTIYLGADGEGSFLALRPSGEA